MSNPFEGNGHYITPNRTSNTMANDPYLTPSSINDTIFQPGHVNTGHRFEVTAADDVPSMPIFHKDTDAIRYVDNVLFYNGLHYKLEAYNRDTDRIDTIARCYSRYELLSHPKPNALPEAVRFYFCGPATVIEWSDGTKTVVKCGEDDTYDAEKGIALCIAKKVFGNKGKYYDVIKKGLKEHEKQCEVQLRHLEELFPEFTNFLNKLTNFDTLKKSTGFEDVVKDALEDSQNGENSAT